MRRVDAGKPALDIGCSCHPLVRAPELAVDALALVDVISHGDEGPAEDLLVEDALEDRTAAGVDVGRGRRVAGDLLRALEVEVVVAATTTEGDGQGDAARPPSGATDPLLVVESAGRHVGEHDGVEGADVDARLHRRRHAEQVDALDLRDLVTDEDLLEPALALGSIVGVGLPGQLLAVHPERPDRPGPGELDVVVEIGRRRGMKQLRCFWAERADANIGEEEGRAAWAAVAVLGLCWRGRNERQAIRVECGAAVRGVGNPCCLQLSFSFVVTDAYCYEIPDILSAKAVTIRPRGPDRLGTQVDAAHCK